MISLRDIGLIYGIEECQLMRGHRFFDPCSTENRRKVNFLVMDRVSRHITATLYSTTQAGGGGHRIGHYDRRRRQGIIV